MPEFSVVKTSNGVRGMTEDDQKALAKYDSFRERLEPGEFYTILYKRPRNIVRHRRFFAMLNLAFDHWDPERGRKRRRHKGIQIAKNFERFRKDVMILAGYGEPSYDLKGRLHLDAKSMAFDAMEDDEFEAMYVAVKDTLFTHILTNYKREDIEHVLAEMERF